MYDRITLELLTDAVHRDDLRHVPVPEVLDFRMMITHRVSWRWQIMHSASKPSKSRSHGWIAGKKQGQDCEEMEDAKIVNLRRLVYIAAFIGSEALIGASMYPDRQISIP
jgi:hypothetical protein